MDTNEAADVFFDRAEFLKAASAPEYRESARYREEVAQKLQRSLSAGRITPMGEQITHDQRSHTRNVYRVSDGDNGYVAPGADPVWAEAAKVTTGYFKSPAEIANAFDAPAFEIDSTYQEAVRQKVARSIREGWLTPDLQPADPSQRGG